MPYSSSPGMETLPLTVEVGAREFCTFPRKKTECRGSPFLPQLESTIKQRPGEGTLTNQALRKTFLQCVKLPAECAESSRNVAVLSCDLSWGWLFYDADAFDLSLVLWVLLTHTSVSDHSKNSLVCQVGPQCNHHLGLSWVAFLEQLDIGAFCLHRKRYS